MSNSLHTFSKYAHSYCSYNIIQSQVVKDLFTKIPKDFKFILDLGAGSGLVYNQIHWTFDQFIALDFSKNMLDLHPQTPKVAKVIADFDNLEVLKKIQPFGVDCIISSSALQWSKDLQKLIATLASFEAKVFFAIFTDGTLKDLRDFSKQERTFLQDASFLQQLLSKYFKLDFEIKTYNINFNNNYDLLKFIQKSGIGANSTPLNFSTTKHLLNHYPNQNLEFEVLLAWTK